VWLIRQNDVKYSVSRERSNATKFCFKLSERYVLVTAWLTEDGVPLVFS
jgi:hypothetical protein